MNVISKLVVILSACFLCNTTNAAVYLSWGVDGQNGSPTILSDSGSYTFYLVNIGTDGLQAVGPGASFSVGDTMIASEAGAPNGYGRWSASVDASDTGNVSTRYAVVVFGTDGKYTAFTTGLYYTDGSATLSADGSPLQQWSAADLSSNGVFGTGTTTWVDPIPEPASMALFGLGAGVIALRRRFKSKKA